MIKGVYKDELTVSYNPPKPKKIVFTEDDLYKSDIFSFGSIIGSITNKGSIAYSMLPNIESEYGKDSKEAKLIISRLQQCCKAQSAQIDKAKIGRDVKGIPDVWINHQYPKVDENGEIIDEKEIETVKVLNNVLLTKKPYFFRHLYDDTNKEYKKYINEVNSNSMVEYSMQLEDLINLKRKTKQQKEFVDNFYAYLPVVISDSPMNMLCRYIESINFSIKNNLKVNHYNEIYKSYLNNEFEFNEEKYQLIVKELDKFISKSRYAWKSGKQKVSNNDDIKEVVPFSFYTDKLKEKINDICSNVYESTNYVVKYFYEYKPSSNKDIVWSMFGKYIFHNIKFNKDCKCKFPLPDDNGDILYLGKRYSLKEIDL